MICVAPEAFEIAYAIVKHGVVLEHGPVSVPPPATYQMSAGSAHVPLATKHTSLEHSLSEPHARHEFVVVSQIGALAGHCESMSHTTHAPVVVSQIWPPQSVLDWQPRHTFVVASHTGADAIVHCESATHATHAPSEPQYGPLLAPVQSLFPVQLATHVWLMQTGAVGSVQSAEVVHWGATQAPVLEQTSPSVQPITPSRPNCWHCSSVVQQAAGLCFVHAVASTSPKNTSVVRMDSLSTAAPPGCAHACYRNDG
jgi:hypothetical protein